MLCLHSHYGDNQLPTQLATYLAGQRLCLPEGLLTKAVSLPSISVWLLAAYFCKVCYLTAFWCVQVMGAARLTRHKVHEIMPTCQPDADHVARCCRDLGPPPPWREPAPLLGPQQA